MTGAQLTQPYRKSLELSGHLPAVGGLGAENVLHDASLLSGQFLKAVFILLSFTESTQDLIHKSPGPPTKKHLKKH